MKYFVIADPHGFYSETQKALEERGFFDEGERGVLIVCGDLLDRGGEACEIIDFMLRLKDEGRLVYILGNHEELLVKMLSELSRGELRSHHIHNGTWQSAVAISGMEGFEAECYPDEVVRGVMRSRFYRELLPFGVNYFETENYIFTHGFIPCNMEGYPPQVSYSYREDWRDATPAEWSRATWYDGMEMVCRYGLNHTGKTVVVGHRRASYGHSRYHGVCSEGGPDAIYTPFYDDGIIGLDACTIRSGWVNCIVIDD